MSVDKPMANEAERWFARYLRERGYDYEYEPALKIDTKPDFRIARGDSGAICEVKSFLTVPRLEKRLDTCQPVAASGDEVYGPLRGAVREAARNLKPLAGAGIPLVVVLANPEHYDVQLDMEHLVGAMYGNPRYAGDVNVGEGRVEEIRFELGRDGRLRNDHPYISAVALLHERDLEHEYYDTWRTGWVKTREALVRPSKEDLVREVEAEYVAWRAHAAEHEVPAGKVYRVDVMTTGSPVASALPDDLFDGSRDTRFTVIRERAES